MIKPRCGSTHIDVSDYILDNSSCVNSIGKVGTGRIILDKNVLNAIPDLASQDEIQIYFGDTTADNLYFTGILDEQQNKDSTDTLNWTIKNYAKLAHNRRFTGVFRDDTGTGDPTDVFKTIVDEKLPELDYDTDSIPAKPTGIENFNDFRKQNVSINEIFDYIANYLNRIWYVDKNKKIHLVERTFTEIDFTLITKGSSAESNLIGDLTVAIDTKRWVNAISVDGKKFPIGIQEKFSGDGSTRLFTLSITPGEIEILVDGVNKTGALVGTDFVDDADYIIDPGAMTIEFTVAETPILGTENVVVNLTFVDKVHDEFQDSGAVARYGQSDGTITDESIETLEQAKEIAQNQLQIYSEPLKIYTGKTFWNSNVEPLNKIKLKDDDREINTKVNIIQTTVTFGKTAFDIRFKLNDFDFTVADMYQNLVNRIERLEFNARSSGQQIAKYVLFGADIGISLDTMQITNRDILGDGIWGIGFGNGVDNDGKWGEAGYVWNGTFANSEIVQRVINANNTFQECFNDDYFKGTGSSDWNTTLRRLAMTTETAKNRFYNTMRQTKVIFKNGETILKATLNATESIWGNDVIRYFLRTDGTNWEEVQIGILYTFVNVGDELEAMIMFSGNGANETYIENLKVNHIV